MMPKILKGMRAELDRLIKEAPHGPPQIRELDIMLASLNLQRQAQQLAAETIFGRMPSASAAIALPATDQSPKELQQQVAQLRKEYEAADSEARQLARQLQSTPDGAQKNDAQKADLRRAVQRAFTARQSLLRAELLEMHDKLLKTQRSIDLRERISDQIIQRRVEDLMNPQLEWDGNISSAIHLRQSCVVRSNGESFPGSFSQSPFRPRTDRSWASGEDFRSGLGRTSKWTQAGNRNSHGDCAVESIAGDSLHRRERFLAFDSNPGAAVSSIGEAV